MDTSSVRPSSKVEKLVSINKNVFLGSIGLYSSYSVIKKYEIMRILTLSKLYNDSYNDKISGIVYKHIRFDEEMRTDLIIHFDHCHQYISESTQYDENILILSADMESLNVTIIIAYMMKTMKLSANEAVAQVMQKWTHMPNNEFFRQLSLWQNMNFRLKSNNQLLCQIVVKQFIFDMQLLLNNGSIEIQSTLKQFLKLSYGLKKTFEHIMENDPKYDSGLLYCCLKCKNGVFYETNIFKNEMDYNCHLIYTQPVVMFLGQIYSNAMALNDKKRLMFGQIQCPYQSCAEIIGIYDWNPKNCCICPLHKDLDQFSAFRFNRNRVTFNLGNE